MYLRILGADLNSRPEYCSLIFNLGHELPVIIKRMTKVHVLRVFTDPFGNYGDIATVVIDEGREISDSKRQQLAKQLDTGETIFINDLASADIGGCISEQSSIIT